MNAPSVDIKDILESDSTLGLEFTQNLFIGKEPAKPDQCVTIYDNMGMAPYLGMAGETGYEYPSIQIRVRTNIYLQGWTLIEKIKELLHGQAQQTWNGTLYSIIYCSSGPALLDYDDNGNCRFIINFNLQRR